MDEKKIKYLRKSEELLKIKPEDIKTEEEAKKIIEELRDVINYHDYLYFVVNEPIITDYQYDQLFHLLEKLEERFPQFITPTSPTQRVASDITKEFPEVKHLSPMLSLENSYNEEDLREFDKRVREILNLDTVEYAVEPKFDGAGIALVYRDDIFARGATRGDGSVGEDITNNLRTIRSLPLEAKFSKYGIDTVEIRGEVVLSKETFKVLNEKRIEEGMPPLANPRNTATGSIRLQDPKEVVKRGLEVFVYQITYATDREKNNLLGSKIKKHSEAIKMLFELGFKSPYRELKVCKGIDEVIDYCREWERKRENYPYEIDGMVIKVNDIKFYEKLGITSHHPRWAIAYKFKARQGKTKLIKVIFQVGRTGAITPVGKLEPVEIGGVIVSSVSLINEDFIKEKDIRVGDTVIVERAGDVIPYIVGVDKSVRTGKEKPIEFPKNCPSCGSPVVRLPFEAVYRCVNINCPAQVLERLIYFASKDAMDIKGLGEATIRRFYKLGFLKSIPDIFRLPYNKIINLEGFGEKSVENLKKSIEEAKNRPIHRLITGLGIRYVGKTTAKTLAEHIKCVEDLKDWSIEKLEKLPDIGYKVATSIYDFFHNEENLKIIRELKDLGVKTCKEDKKEEKKADILKGLTFVFTGALNCCSREEAKSIVESLGGKVSNSVSKKTSYVIVGENPGSKYEKALKLGVKILNEEEFLNLIKNHIPVKKNIEKNEKVPNLFQRKIF